MGHRTIQPGPEISAKAARMLQTKKRATDAVRGVDQPKSEGVAAIGSVLKTLPRRPGSIGCRMPEALFLYVGKARALKNRVTSLNEEFQYFPNAFSGWFRKDAPWS